MEESARIRNMKKWGNPAATSTVEPVAMRCEALEIERLEYGTKLWPDVLIACITSWPKHRHNVPDCTSADESIYRVLYHCSLRS